MKATREKKGRPNYLSSSKAEVCRPVWKIKNRKAAITFLPRTHIRQHQVNPRKYRRLTDIFLRETSPLLSPFTFRVFLRKYFHKKKSYQRDKERFEVELNKELCVPKHLGEIKLPEPQCMEQPDSLQ